MDQDNDAGYYRRREIAARALAASSSDKAIRQIHTEMADRYAAKALSMRKTLRLVGF